MIIPVLLVATALPPGTVVVGISTIDGTNTDVVAVTPSGEREVLTALDHARGRIPKGHLVADDVLETVAAVDDGTKTVLEQTNLDTGQRRLLDTGAIATQVPVASLPVHDDGDGHFTIGLPLGNQRHVDGAWLTPIVGARAAWLALDDDGTQRIVTLASGANALHVALTLDKARYRSPTQVGDRWILERAIDASHAEIVDAASRAVLWRGLPGMDPRMLDATRVAFGAGTKRGAVVIARIEDGKLNDVVTLDSGMQGAATPLAAEVVDGRVIVVAWLNRGAALPGALIKLTQTDRGTVTDLLAQPEAGAAYEVYGVTR